MQKGFWEKLNKPVLALAPMANVTDAAFRFIIAKYGKPDVMWTEFVSCDGLVSSGRERLLPDLWFDESERPIVAQFFSATPENFYQCAQLAQELGFHGIDINMGCPDRTIEKQGAGAALIKNPELAKEIIKATKRGAGSLPVSVKTRIGFHANTLKDWLPHLLEADPAAITIHARTRKEMSKVPAHWEAVAEGVSLRDKYFSGPAERPLILGNGDVTSIAEAEAKAQQTGADGIMIGRGIFGNPWLFNRERAPQSITLEERLKVMIEHTYLFEQKFNHLKSFELMKKHYKAYVAGFDTAKELRMKLMEKAKSAAEVERIVKSYFPNL
jgi:nifR3 family TIM-barrel protein